MLIHGQLRLRFLSPAIFLLFPSSSWSECTTQNTAVNFPASVSIQRDAPVGTILATVQTSTNITCDSKGSNGISDGSWGVYSSSTNQDYGNSTLAQYRKTPNEGLGFYWSNLNSYSKTSQVMTLSAINNSTKNYRGIALDGTTTFTDTWKLVKTGEMKSGIINLPAITMEYQTLVSKQDKGALFTYNFTPIALNVLACSILNSSINVALDPINVNRFTSLGMTDGDKKFTIGLDCDAGARINVSLSGTQNADTSNNSVLALNNSDSPGSATGVGIQLLYDNNPLKLGDHIALKTSSGGNEFPVNAFTARYYQTKAIATAGEANTTATLNLTYQ